MGGGALELARDAAYVDGAGAKRQCKQLCRRGGGELRQEDLLGRHVGVGVAGRRQPVGQAEHVSTFWFSENRPAAHTTHVSSALLRRLPALHSEQDALPLPAERPALQAVQAVASGTSVKVSSRQTWQSRWPSRGLARPGMHGRHDAWPVSF